MKYYCGIDCGLSGAIALIPKIGKNVLLFNNYTYKNEKGKKSFNMKTILSIFKEYDIIDCAIEQTQVLPHQGSVSGWTIGLNNGILIGLLFACYINYTIVNPRKWIKYYTDKAYTKELGYKLVCKLYPDIKNELKGPKGGLLDGKCDAILIAHYIKETNNDKKAIN